MKIFFGFATITAISSTFSKSQQHQQSCINGTAEPGAHWEQHRVENRKRSQETHWTSCYAYSCTPENRGPGTGKTGDPGPPPLWAENRQVGTLQSYTVPF